MSATSEMTPENATETPPQIVMVQLGDIQRSATNPRQRFDAVKINDLAESIRQRGVRTPLWVRPRWCVGWDGTDINARRPDPELTPADEVTALLRPFDLVAGECRYRGALLAEKTEVPVIIYEVGDAEALELQLLENLQRSDLDPLEEAEGFQQMLKLKDAATGDDAWTVESLAKRLNCSKMHISRRLKLLAVPEVAREALRDGTLPANVAVLIGRVPDPALREKAAKEILAGESWKPGVMSLRDAETHIERHYMRSITGASFDTTDATLVPEMGPCTTCPYLAKNSPDVDVASGTKSGVRADMCLNPACFLNKTQAAHDRFEAENKGSRRKVLTVEANSKLMDAEGFNFYSSKIVDMDAHPRADLVSEDLAKKTWRQILKGQEVEVIVGRTKSGKAIEGVNIAAAVEAAKGNGHAVANPWARDTSNADRELEREKENPKRELDRDVFVKIVTAIPDVIKADPVLWLGKIMLHAFEKELYDDDLEKVIGKTAEEIRVEMGCGLPARVCVIAAQCYLFTQKCCNDHELSDEGKAVVKSLGLDEKAIRKEIVAEAKKLQVFILPAAEDLAKPATILWEPKARIFKVRDEAGGFEISPRAAFCVGWNDIIEGKVRKPAQIAGWSRDEFAAYGEGQRQAGVTAALPDMKAMAKELKLLQGAREVRAKWLATGSTLSSFSVSIVQKQLKVDYDTACRLADRLIDEDHDELEAKKVPAVPVKAKKAKAKTDPTPPEPLQVFHANAPNAGKSSLEAAALEVLPRPAGTADDAAATIIEVEILNASIDSISFKDSIRRATDSHLEQILKLPEFAEAARREAVIEEIARRLRLEGDGGSDSPPNPDELELTEAQRESEKIVLAIRAPRNAEGVSLLQLAAETEIATADLLKWFAGVTPKTRTELGIRKQGAMFYAVGKAVAA